MQEIKSNWNSYHKKKRAILILGHSFCFSQGISLGSCRAHTQSDFGLVCITAFVLAFQQHHHWAKTHITLKVLFVLQKDDAGYDHILSTAVLIEDRTDLWFKEVVYITPHYISNLKLTIMLCFLCVFSYCWFLICARKPLRYGESYSDLS